MGYVPEAETPLEDFRTEALKCYDVTMDRVAGIHRVGTSVCGDKGFVVVFVASSGTFLPFFGPISGTREAGDRVKGAFFVITVCAEGCVHTLMVAFVRIVGPDDTSSMYSLGLLLGPSTPMYPSLHCRDPARKGACGNRHARVVSRFVFHRYNVL